MLKSKEPLQNMNPVSIDTALSNIFSRHEDKCNNLEDICPADFATEHKSNRRAKKRRK